MIFSTKGAFAALSTEGNVITWGHPLYGRASIDVQEKLKNIKMIFSTEGAFAALTMEGKVITWGHHKYGGDSRAAQNRLKNLKVLTIIPSKYEFVVKTEKGYLVTISWNRSILIWIKENFIHANDSINHSNVTYKILTVWKKFTIFFY